MRLPSQDSRIRFKCFSIVFSILVVSAQGIESTKPVFVKASSCDGRISSVAIYALQEEISRSAEYRLVKDLSDEGKMDVVLTINLSCTERDKIGGVATAYGHAKCLGVKNCHYVIDGSSLRSALCDSETAVQCGKSQFKSFNDYVRHSNP